MNQIEFDKTVLRDWPLLGVSSGLFFVFFFFDVNFDVRVHQAGYLAKMTTTARKMPEVREREKDRPIATVSSWRDD